MDQLIISNIFKAFNLVSRNERRKNDTLSKHTKELLEKMITVLTDNKTKVKPHERK
jgi:hypothetical protein